MNLTGNKTFKKRLFIGILLTVFFISCKKNADKPIHNPSIETISVTIKDEKIKISSILDSVSCNFFYSDNDLVIGTVDKIISDNDHYYVFDSKQSEILVFENSGRFDYVLSKKGYGPGEYNNISDFTIFKDMICILDINKIFMYSLKGEYLKTIYLEFTATKFENINNTYFSFFRHSNIIRAKNLNFDLIITNENGKILRKYFPYTELDAENNITTQNVFYVSNDDVYYIHRFNDTIYSLKNGYLKPKYHIDFGTNKMPSKPIVNNKYLNYPHFIKNFSENQDHIIFSFTYNAFVYHAIYDKITHKSICYKSLLSDNIFLFVGGAPFISSEKGFYAIFEPYDLAAFFNDLRRNSPKESESLLDTYPNFEELFYYLETSQVNPILVFQKYDFD